MHDAMCMSSCPPGDGDHAKRTQSDFARDAVRAWKAGESLADLIHDRACPCLGRVEAADRGRHVAAFEKAAVELAGLLRSVTTDRALATARKALTPSPSWSYRSVDNRRQESP